MRRALDLLLLALLLAGCSETRPTSSPVSDSKNKTTPTETAVKLPEPAPAAGIELKKLKYAEFEQVIAKYKGKLVVADFWFEG
jgi:hypothetical protein